MLEKLKNSRYYQIVAVFALLMIILLVRLLLITVVDHDKWKKEADNLSTKTIETNAARGEIYDRNGKLLAGNRQVFNVKISDTGLDSENLNDTAERLIKLFKKNGDKYEDDFPIVIKNGSFEFTYQKEIRSWLKKQNMPSDYTAEQAFNQLRSNLGIDEKMDKYDAQLAIQEAHGEYPPISVGSTIRYTYDDEQKTFLEKYGLDDTSTAEQAFKELRKSFEIDDSISDKSARKIMIVRNAIKDLGYARYMPATIAKNISDETLIEIEENPDKYQGVEVVTEAVRYYPEGSLASHILGYIGSINNSELEAYKEKGYSASQLVGQSGIESKYESKLKGKNGSRLVQVDVLGNLTKVLKTEEPKKGEDIYLTIDKNLQKVAEDSLASEIRACRAGGVYSSVYGSYVTTPASKCESGAVVALDVKSGDVLAMASYPDFDPNLFAEGISSKDWNSLQSDNTRDSLSPQPLYNIATRTAVQPGSTFKMVTATAALEKGLDPYMQLYDPGYVDIGDTRYACVAWTKARSRHGYLNMKRALAVSCNVYFYDIVNGKDYANGGASLGYKCGVDTLLQYASQYGLGHSTGIELAETETEAPSAANKIAATESAVSNLLWNKSVKYFDLKTLKDEKKLGEDIATIAGWTKENPSYEELVKRLPKYGIKKSAAASVAEVVKYSYFNQAGWTEGDALNISIGQGENAYTPLQVCNYIATLGNKGVKNQVSVVKSVGGKKNQKEKGKKIDISKDFSFSPIMEGMIADTQEREGSLYSVFSKFPVVVAGKTGTAEKAGKINPPDEVEYVKSHLSSITSVPWSKVEAEMKRIMTNYPNTYTTEDIAVRQALMNVDSSVTASKIDQFKGDYDNFAWVVALAPADDPQIAVCVLLVQGEASANAGPIAREVIGSYLGLDKKKNKSKNQTAGQTQTAGGLQ